MAFGKAAPAHGGATDGPTSGSAYSSEHVTGRGELTRDVWGDSSAPKERDQLTKERARLIGNLTGVGVRLFLIMLVGWVRLSAEIYVPVIDDFAIWIIFAMIGDLTRVVAKMMKPDA